MPELNWYEIPCPVCGAEETNSWDKRISRALGYKHIVCEKCIATEYDIERPAWCCGKEKQYGN